MGKKPNPDTTEPFGIGCSLDDLEPSAVPQIPVTPEPSTEEGDGEDETE